MRNPPPPPDHDSNPAPPLRGSTTSISPAEQGAAIQDAYENSIQPQLDPLNPNAGGPGGFVGDPSISDSAIPQSDAQEPVATASAPVRKISFVSIGAIALALVSLLFVTFHLRSSKK